MPEQSLPELLAERRVKLASQRPGHTEQVICPKCEGGRTREKSLSVTLDADGLGVVMQCHRGSCGYQDGARVASNRVQGGARYRPATPIAPTPTKRPEAHPVASQGKPDWMYQFFAERGIGCRTVDAFGIYAMDRFYAAFDGKRPSLVFPYIFSGELVNRKYRPHPEKQPQQQDKDALQTIYNIDSLGSDPDEIVWVEGEVDCLALHECGIPHVISLKDGAPAKVSDDPSKEDKRFAALRTHLELLGKAKRVLLAGDMDAPGMALREELARRLGRHRCHTVDWPEGCKDACDVLKMHGPEMVQDCIARAKPYPIEGLQKVERGTLLALRHGTPPEVMTTGSQATDDMGLRFPREGRLIVVTGYPGSGKTSWVRFAMVHHATRYKRRWAVFSPEMQPWEQFAASVAEAWSGKTFYPERGRQSMSDPEIAAAEDWINNRLTMLVCDAEDEAPTLDWVLEKARGAVLRDGCTDLLIDPWNEIDHARPGNMTETEYTGRCLQRLKAFGLRHGCNIWVICHPAKPPAIKNGETHAVPTAYAINGSAHWFNKADLGLTVHSPGKGTAEVHCWKARFRRFGSHPSSAMLDYDPSCGRYFTPDMGSDGLAPPTSRWEN